MDPVGDGLANGDALAEDPGVRDFGRRCRPEDKGGQTKVVVTGTIVSG